jgi:hypothetical protein
MYIYTEREREREGEKERERARQRQRQRNRERRGVLNGPVTLSMSDAVVLARMMPAAHAHFTTESYIVA